jgi:hypothetical protein
MKNLKNLIIILGIICCCTAFVGGMHYQKGLCPEPEVIEIEKKVDVVKFVEKSKTLTQDFIIHLNPNVDPEMSLIMAKAIDESSAKYRLPRKLVCSIIMKESLFNPFARSKAGAVGLMQIMPKIHADKHIDKNLWHIASNIDVGCQIFREYLDAEHGIMTKAFHRYLSKNASKSEVKNYTDDIYSNWAILEMFDYLSIAEKREAEKQIELEQQQKDQQVKEKNDDENIEKEK